MSDNFSRSNGEPTLYIKQSKDMFLTVVLYVDDLIFMGNDETLVEEFKEAMKREFEMIDLGLLKFFLGIEIQQEEQGIFVSQSKYAKVILKRFRMETCNPALTPTAMGIKLCKYDFTKSVNPTLYKSMVGSLMYLMATCPNIMYVVSLISRFMENPRASHLQVAKRILRYVQGIVIYGISYIVTNEFKLIRYMDSDWNGSFDDKKSTSGYLFHLGSGAISWA